MEQQTLRTQGEEEILHFMKLERVITTFNYLDGSLHQETDTIPASLMAPYLLKLISLMKREFVDKYKVNYTMLCNTFLTQSSNSVNEVIASYVQLTTSKTFGSYSLKQPVATEKEEKDKLYHELQKAFQDSEHKFRELFRAPYLEIIKDLDIVLRSYELLRLRARNESQFSFDEFLELKLRRTDLRDRIDSHLMQMLEVTKVEAKITNRRL